VLASSASLEGRRPGCAGGAVHPSRLSAQRYAPRGSHLRMTGGQLSRADGSAGARLSPLDPDHAAFLDRERQLAALELQCGIAEQLAAPAA